MDRNTLTGLLLMMALLFGYQWYISPTDEEIAAWEAQQEAEAASQDSLAQAALEQERDNFKAQLAEREKEIETLKGITSKSTKKCLRAIMKAVGDINEAATLLIMEGDDDTDSIQGNGRSDDEGGADGRIDNVSGFDVELPRS